MSTEATARSHVLVYLEHSATRLGAIPASATLALLVASSFVVRTALAFAHATPLYFPDEYIYSSLARSLGETGRPLIRGAGAHFPALLEPLLAAPFWIGGNAELAYRLTQAENALAMSLAAVPVYFLVRKLGLRHGFAIGAAALSVLSGDLFFASFLLADPIAYLLVLSAVYFGVCAIAEPSVKREVQFAAFCGAAAFARLQFVVLPLVFVIAAVLVDRGHAVQTVRRLRLSLAIFVAPVVILSAVGPSRLLGYYSGIADLKIRPEAILHWLFTDTRLLSYPASWVLVPGAVVGLGYALFRSRSRVERAYAAFTVVLTTVLLLEAAAYATNGSRRFQERYLFALLPLVAPAFLIYMERAKPHRRLVGVIAFGMLGVAVTRPPAEFIKGGDKQDSPFLFALYEMEKALGSTSGRVAVASLGALFSVLAVMIGSSRRGAVLGIAVSGSIACITSAGTYKLDIPNSRQVRAQQLPAHRDWIDRTGLRHVAVLQTPGAPGEGHRALQQLIWNSSVDRMLLLGNVKPPDAFAASRASIDADGTLRVGARTVRQPLLVNQYGVRMSLRGARRIARGPAFDLWQPVGTPRVALAAIGQYFDGWLVPAAVVDIWPGRSGRTDGTLRLALSLPPRADESDVRFTSGGFKRQVEIRPGRRHVLCFRIATQGSWSLRIDSAVTRSLGDGRIVGVQAEAPIFTQSPRKPAGCERA